jgi:hypothetical protein
MDNDEMTEEKRKRLLDTANALGLTWHGDKAHVAGWKSDLATVTTRRPFFWGCSWEAVERAIKRGDFDGEALWLTSRAWLGY